jgi:hypothetical protein
MPTKRCTLCGTIMENVRKDKRFCSDSCRSKHTRGTEVVDSPGDVLDGDLPMGKVETRVLAELTQVKQHETAQGEIALALARRLDRPRGDTGAAIASVAKQLEASLRVASAGAVSEGDELDELRRRRDERRAASNE